MMRYFLDDWVSERSSIFSFFSIYASQRCFHWAIRYCCPSLSYRIPANCFDCLHCWGYRPCWRCSHPFSAANRSATFKLNSTLKTCCATHSVDFYLLSMKRSGCFRWLGPMCFWKLIGYYMRWIGNFVSLGPRGMSPGCYCCHGNFSPYARSRYPSNTPRRRVRAHYFILLISDYIIT